MTGVWVLAHEAGHSAFSPQLWVNDLVGWTFHSLLLVPYFSWKFTHASYVPIPRTPRTAHRVGDLERVMTLAVLTLLFHP